MDRICETEGDGFAACWLIEKGLPRRRNYHPLAPTCAEAKRTHPSTPLILAE